MFRINLGLREKTIVLPVAIAACIVLVAALLIGDAAVVGNAFIIAICLAEEPGKGIPQLHKGPGGFQAFRHDAGECDRHVFQNQLRES